MRVDATRRGWSRRVTSAVVLGSVFVALSSSTAWAWPSCNDDKRAEPVNIGNPRSCASVGLHADTQVGSSSGLSASDVNVAGTVQTNEGRVQPGTGQDLDVTITGPSTIDVDAVVVDSGNRHNTYRWSQYLPPALARDQHYIAPFNLAHRVPDIQYWFVCYHVDPPTSLPDVPQVLEIPLAAGAAFAAFLFVQRRRRHGTPAS